MTRRVFNNNENLRLITKCDLVHVVLFMLPCSLYNSRKDKNCTDGDIKAVGSKKGGRKRMKKGGDGKRKSRQRVASWASWYI